MKMLKIGSFPGRLNDYAIEAGTTVKQALEMAGISVTDEQEIKLDDRTVTPSDAVDNGNMLIVTKRIKGNK